MNKTLILILLIALILRISGALLFPAYSGGDEWFNYEIILHHSDKLYSQKIIDYYSLNLLNDYFAHTPIYYIIANFFNSFYLIRIFQAIISIFSIFIVFHLIKLISTKKIALYSSLFITFLPSHIIESATINPDVLFSLFIFLMFYFLFFSFKHRLNFAENTDTLFISIFFFVLAFYTKLIALWLVVPLGIGITYFALKYERKAINYLVIILVIGFYFFFNNLKYLSSYGTNLDIMNLNVINLGEFSRVFAGFFLQEYGTAIIPDLRFMFFYFFLFCCFVLLYYILINKINFNVINSLVAISIISVIVGTFYIGAFSVFPQGKYFIGLIPFFPLIYFSLVENAFWRNALIIALILFTGLLFASISSVPLCVPYPVPVNCLKA